MATDPSADYGAQVDTSDPTGYPYGQARNITTPSDGTGTPLEKRWLSDLWGLLQSLLKTAGDIIPSGTPDKVGASQYQEALDRLYAPTFIEVTATGSTNLIAGTDYPAWAKWAYVEVSGSGAGGKLGSGGGGSGYKAKGWLDLTWEAVTSIQCTIGAGVTSGLAGNSSNVRVGSSVVQAIQAAGAPAVPATGPGAFPGGDGYSGGGGRGASGGVAGQAGSSTAIGIGGAGILATTGDASGIVNPALAGADGTGAPDTGGGGGAAGHWPGVDASDGADGTGGVDAGAGGKGGKGVGAGGGGGGALGTMGANGAGGTSARGGARLWFFRSRPL